LIQYRKFSKKGREWIVVDCDHQDHVDLWKDSHIIEETILWDWGEDRWKVSGIKKCVEKSMNLKNI
jgi:hypothetical protein